MPRRQLARALARQVREADVQRACVRYLTLTGWSVWRIGQRDARGTQDAGVPDLVAFRAGQMIWLECKRPVGGRQSPAQRRFQAACEAAGVAYHVIRSLDELVALVTGGRDG